MTISNFIVLYWYIFISLFTPDSVKKWEEMAMKNVFFSTYQSTDNRNEYWLALSYRDREILVEYILIAIIGKSPDNLRNSMLDAMHTAALQGKLVANK